MQPYKILWVDDDQNVLDSAERLFRSTPWTLVTALTADEGRTLLAQDSFAAVIADQNLKEENGVSVLEFAKERSPATSRILVTGMVGVSVVEEAVNRGHVFRFITKPWENDRLLADVAKATEHHQLKITQASLLKEVSLQNRQLEQLTFGLEQLVTERTLTAESSKVEAERKLSHVRELVRFIKDLSHLTSIEELMGLVRKELKAFHELRPPVLGYMLTERRPMIITFQGKQATEREARQVWSRRSRMRINELEDRVYLANEFGRPFVKVLAIPLKRRALTMSAQSAPVLLPLSARSSEDAKDESPATLFFEHTLPDERIEPFLAFVSERLQPLSIALDRILLEYHLKYTALHWESTFDGIKDPIAIVDIDYQIVRANRHFNQPGGIATPRSFETRCHKVLIDSDTPCRGCPIAEALKTGEPQKGIIKQGGATYEVLSYPIRLHSASVSTNVINQYVDVTAARELHSRMIQSEKMAAIGLLAGNIAHELNNPLTGIRSLSQVLLSEVPQGGTLREDIGEVEKAAARSQKIIENLLDFSKGNTDRKRTATSLNEIVRRTLPMLKTAMRDHRSEIKLHEEEVKVRVEPHLMQQVVFNLVNNACQAMTNPGTIGIETAVSEDWCELRVKDTGSGIPREIIDTIFEPFFTTKERGQGTGLGLSMSRSVIEDFGGTISVKSEAGEGTEFFVRLPIVERRVT